MTSLQETTDAAVAEGLVPGAVALVAQGDEVTVATAGVRTEAGEAMTPDSLFRIASITKPILAAATMVLVDRGRFALDDPVARWLPELAEPAVLRRLDGPVDDVVPAVRPITVRHLLTFQGGHGFPSDFSAPVVRGCSRTCTRGRPSPRPPAARTSGWPAWRRIPLLHQPGEGWTYNTGADILGVLLARVEGAPLGEVLADTVLDPLGMADTGFAVPGRAPRPHDRPPPPHRRRRPRADRPARRPVGDGARVPVRGRRAGVDGRRLAGLRPHAAGRWRARGPTGPVGRLGRAR